MFTKTETKHHSESENIGENSPAAHGSRATKHIAPDEP